MVRSVTHGNRIEPMVFNRTTRAVKHYGKSGVRTYPWDRLHPVIRIVRVVGIAGGAQSYQLVLADVDPATGKIGSKFIAGKGDLIGAAVLRFGLFNAYMSHPLDRLPHFQLVSVAPDWFQRLAISIWTAPTLAVRWLGEKPWSMLVGLGGALTVIVAMPLQMPELLAARITQGPYGERSLGPWMKRFSALPETSVLRTLVREEAGVARPARQCIVVALAIGTLFWFGVAWFMAGVLFD